MPVEIERKFLVATEGWKDSVIKSIHIRDGLVASSNGNKTRVRIAGSVATITLKGRRLGPTRAEFEYEIPCSDADEIIRTMCSGRVLDKVRHFVSHAGDTWHVDVYKTGPVGLVLAEIELRNPNQQFEIPNWIGKEITNDARFKKINLRNIQRYPKPRFLVEP